MTATPKTAPVPYWYLATVYSLFPSGRENAHRFACEQAGLLMKYGVPVCCPIAHSHSIAQFTKLPDTHDYWMEADAPMLTNSKGVIVVKSDEWKHSRGIAHEIHWAHLHNKPVIYMEPWVIPEEVLKK